MKLRIVFVTSHPIQYQGPLWRKLAAHPGIDVTVLFGCDHGGRAGQDQEDDGHHSRDAPGAGPGHL